MTAAQLFGRLIKRERERASRTQAELAEVAHLDRSIVARIEAGERVPDKRQVVLWDDMLETDDLLLDLWRQVDWYPTVQRRDWFERRAEMDRETTALRIYQNQFMPGLVQTEAYANAAYAQVVRNRDDLKRCVEARLRRQDRFVASDPGSPLLSAILTEDTLRTVVGGPEVMAEQCAHLLHLAELPNFVIQVVPSNCPPVVRPSAPMTIISTPNGRDWVYSESIDYGHFVNDPARVQELTRLYTRLAADALSTTESAQFIQSVMEGYQ
ncbi:helix-turn-helix domain-containing protein [Streptomyces zagrosensis]|uniref:Transcriptional regulator with XRE-family HTH domain n=1 Tax=Streptomyces zagrosensis TaxID=1042984 RepID=A0A7W9QI49_9ACTN|nr:helix-turn-helix transcriptional regulator [Streptomyces zagrosensis]MBB5940138.1 transcriptional regulator with XRE-family HTH domain [Streptomyces zagrosensis]